MAICDSTSPPPDVEYGQLPWGDLIYGTKEQLQALGLAVGMAFPGEEGAPKRNLIVTDPRGFECRITDGSHYGECLFCASIPLPGREQPKEDWVTFASGVRRKKESRTDNYVGTAEALAAAGLIQLDQLPGQPGMRKVTVTILPDGSLPKGAPTANCSASRAPGAKRIQRASKTTYQVSVVVEEDEQHLRWEQYRLEQDIWEARMSRLPRPAPLNSSLSVLAKHQRTAIIPKCRIVGNVIYLPRA